MAFLKLLAATSAFVVMGAAPGYAQAQQVSDPSVESYLCTFAGKCGDQSAAAEQVTREAPATKGFRLARGPQQSQTPTTETAPTTRGFRVARPVPVATAKPKPVAAKPTPAPRYSTPAAPRPAAVARAPLAAPRADLMIGFELGSDRMTSAGLAKARVFARSLLVPELRAKRFQIEGHTDSRGNPDANIELSRRRAQAVADFLVEQGVDRTRLEVVGKGSATPLPGRRATDPINRRVEAELIS